MINDERGIVPRKIKGFRDIDQHLNKLRWHIISKASEVYQQYGFEHWDTPIMEYADNIGKYLPDADEVAEGIYSFKNPELEPVLKNDGKELRDENDKVVMDHHHIALRYDLTAPLARHYAERIFLDAQRGIINSDNAPLYRRYQYGTVYRFEAKLDPGRFREFWQLDFDSVGTHDTAADAEVCMILSEALENIGLERGTYQIKVNNRKILKGLLISLGVESESEEQNILRIIDKADKIGLEGVKDELGKGREDSSGAFINGLNLDNDIIGRIMVFFNSFAQTAKRNDIVLKLQELKIDNDPFSHGINELIEINEILSELDYREDRIIFDPTLVRGMAYYTGPIFEVESLLTYKDRKGQTRQVGSICGGGRYDNLVENLTGVKVPATGASIGVDRLAEILILAGKSNFQKNGPVLIIVFDETLMDTYQKIAQDLRKHEIPAEIYYGAKKGLKKQFQYADKKNAPFAIIMGEDEKEKGIVTIKDLKLGREASNIQDKEEWKAKVQTEVNIEEISRFLLDKLKK